ncbi:HTH-type transcriptional regulator MtrR [compost metagenome]
MEPKKKGMKREAILKAATDIIRSQGVEHLTLDAVAQEAGVSKGGLLYHFPNKEELIQGMVQGLTRTFISHFEKRVAEDQEEDGKWSRAYVNATYTGLEEGQDMDAALSASLFTNPKLLTELQTEYGNWQKKIENDGLDPVLSSIIRLAVDGLWFSEMFGLAAPDAELKKRIIEELNVWTKEKK